MSNQANEALSSVCSAIQYLHDRCDMDSRLTDVETRVRYTDNIVSEFIVNWDGRRIRFTAEDIGEAPRFCDICGDDFMGDPQEDPEYPGAVWCGVCKDE